MSSEHRRVAVFGGSGYIGGRLSSYLSAQGRGVASVSRSVLDVLAASEPDIRRMVEGCDAVVSLIGANENAAAKDPQGARRLAATAAKRVGDAVAECGIRRLIHFSTIHVYGALSGEITESRPPAPVAPYGAAHWEAETKLQELGARRGTDIVILRLSNAVGPPATPQVDRWTLLTNDLARTLAEKGELRLRSSGLAWRDFIALSEVCRATRHVLALPFAKGVRLFNLGTGQARRVVDVAQRMAELAQPIMGRRPDLVRPSAGDAAPEMPAFALRLEALNRTGFVPATAIDEELSSLIRFALEHFGRRAPAG